MPSILEMQGAISQGAASGGVPRRRATTRLPADHPAQCELDLAMSDRSIEHDKLRDAVTESEG